MMRSCFMLLTVALSLHFHAASGQEQAAGVDPWPDITEAFASGNARELAESFSSMVDLGLPEGDNSYSKSQGEIVMRDFFKKTPPDGFEVKQTGKTSEKSHFAICQYESSGKNYQVSIYVKQELGVFLITRIKFEKQ